MNTKEYKKLKQHALKNLDALIGRLYRNPTWMTAIKATYRDGYLEGLERGRREVMLTRRPV